MKLLPLAIFILLMSYSFSSLLWQFSTDGQVTKKPLAYQNMIVVPSEDGKIYALEPQNGNKKWATYVGKSPNDITVVDGNILTTTKNGKIVVLDQTGKQVWASDLNVTQYNVSYVYGASANQKSIFVSANNGIYILDRSGNVKSKLDSFSDSTVTPPVAGSNYVVYGRNKELLKVNENGQRIWNVNITDGSFWLGKPVIDGETVYIGALDQNLHAINGGLEVWVARTKGWVVGTPLVKNNQVYFGSNDGNVYALSASGGAVNWIAETPLGVKTEPELGSMGGAQTVFIGSSDKNIYAIDSGTGEILWKGSAGGALGSPLFYQNSVIVGSEDKNIYAYSTDRACSILSPTEGEIIGFKEVQVKGKYVTQFESAQIMIKVNDGTWEAANTTGSNWVYYINPKTKFNPGLNTISCKVVDNAGEETGTVFTTVAINHDQNTPLSTLVISTPGQLVEGVPFTIYVNDGDDEAPVDRLTINLNGKTFNVDKNVTTTINQPGDYKITVKKIGFKDGSATITVNPKGASPIVLVIGGLAVLIILSQLWSRVIKQRFVKR
ncbi:PQQ-binding-like beta-propeller repeat protein [Candidatus Micrarchaeota archaeon]|nr:PQQ-binding-like beta-propeller repeat protein [Candidatus Micrarchaeota archaeon]